MSTIYKVSAANSSVVARLREQLHIPEFIATVMATRGIATIEQAERFLHPSLERDWHNPYDISGMEDVVSAAEAAVRKHKRIVVFGDFDVDGISATTVLTRGLRALGAHATPFIPRRFEEGYALSEAALERVKLLKPDVIITVDCGIACATEVAHIKEMGIDVIVTDHHEPPEHFPQGVPLVDPKVDPNHPSSILAGVGVALKVIQALGARFGFPHLWRSYTDLATLGTVADLMPMRDENRALVKEGLEHIAHDPRPCIKALMECAGVADKAPAATDLGFSIIPRLNAAGRMGDASIALDLLMTDDYNKALELARQLEGINDRRRAIEAELSELARDMATHTYHGQRALVVAGEDWHEGVKGIVANRLARIYGVPCLLFTIDGDEARGSGRTIGQVNLFKAVESTADILTRFGGHEAAVGITLPRAHLDEFTQRLCAYMDTLPEEDFHPLVQVDAVVRLSELTLENVDALQMLAPFGQENQIPVFMARDVAILNARAVGADKNHFSCTLSDGRSKVDAIMFHCKEIAGLLKEKSLVTATFELRVDEWRGRQSVKAMLKTIAPVEPCSALQACLDPENCEFVSNLLSESDEELCREAEESVSVLEEHETLRRENRQHWETLARENPAELQSAIIRGFIGDGSLHDTQRKVLDLLDAGTGVACVMATGRGKSLIFHVHAAKVALARGGVSMFVYPLRALINDQAFHLTNALGQFGIVAEVLNGETTPENRARIYGRLVRGECDILLTTPEYLSIHATTIGTAHAIDFLVIDEAHHIGLAKEANRAAYKDLARLQDALGNPTVLALTATAPDDVMNAIKEQLPVEQCVYDATDRPNLILDDQRNQKSREDVLARLVATGEKTVIYVNSRMGSVRLVRSLRRKVPHIALMIGFYNAGLSRAERARIEEMFRTGEFSVLVATSAFGEGVNIPDIRHVVLYHMPYNEIEFNQMSGRAGRDGALAGVHLLYTSQDADTNRHILSTTTPNRTSMAAIYRVLREMSQQAAETKGWVAVDYPAVIKRVATHGSTVEEASVDCALAVFRELGLFDVRVPQNAGAQGCEVRLVSTAQKVDLEKSIRYREGLDERAVFEAFKKWAMHKDSDVLRERMIRPILPERTLA